MKRLLLWITRIVLSIIFLAAIAAAVILYHDNRSLLETLSKQKYGVVSSDVRRLIVADLGSGDRQRISEWKDYFQHTLELESNLPPHDLEITDLLNRYKAHEMPGRSNYFADIFNALAANHEYLHLKKQEVITYLGMPDESHAESGGETLDYRFWSYGRESLGSVYLTNNVVSYLGFGPIPSGAPGKGTAQ